MPAAQDQNAARPADWKKRQGFRSALIQIVIAAAVLAGIVFFVVHRGNTRKQIADLVRDARGAEVHDNPADLQRALQQAEQILAIDPHSADAMAMASDLETELWLTHLVPGADAKARDYLAQAEAQNARSEDRFASHVRQLVAADKAAEAAQYAEDLRKQGANGAKLWYALGGAYQKTGNLPLARQAFFKAADHAYRNPRFAAAYAEALIDEGLYDQALEAANKGISASADHVRSRLDAALANLLKGDKVREAASVVKDVLSRDADLSPGLKARALAVQAEQAVEERRPDEVERLVSQALALNPQEHYALLARARALAQKRSPQALAAYQAAIAVAPTAPAIYFDGAATLQAQGNSSAASALLKAYEATFKDVTYPTTDGKLESVLDHDDRYWITRGDILRTGGKLDAAMGSYDKAIAANGLNVSKAHYAKGALLIARRDYDKGMDELKVITPEDGSGRLPEAYLAMGDALFAKKDYPSGCQSYAWAMARLKTQQAPKEQLEGVLQDVNRKLLAAGQKAVAQAWVKEAQPLAQ